MKDDWKYTRTRQQHFTEAELEFIRTAHAERRRVTIVARELGCSSRVIYTRYAELNGAIRKHRIYERKPPPRAKPKEAARAISAARFYKSDFIPK